jgi:DNA polymerase bacteriophage-type
MLHLDFETRSHLDIRKVGTDVYARNCEVLMMAYAWEDDPPSLWLPGEPFPTTMIWGPERKAAWNAAFERAILRHRFEIYTPPSDWVDVPNLVRYATMPAKLKGASEYLQLGDLAKHDGSRLINKFCKPHKGRFIEPEEAPDDWETFKEYCKQDVVAEREILHRLQRTFSLGTFEQRVATLDMEINERGIPVDMQFVSHARDLVAAEKHELKDELRELTGLANPNSGQQMLGWLRERGYPYNSLLKKRVDKAMQGELLPEVRRALTLRAKLSRSSTSKLDAIVDRVSPDGRLRGSYVYLGASRTGRWSGSGVQLQNLPR